MELPCKRQTNTMRLYDHDWVPASVDATLDCQCAYFGVQLGAYQGRTKVEQAYTGCRTCVRCRVTVCDDVDCVLDGGINDLFFCTCDCCGDHGEEDCYCTRRKPRPPHHKSLPCQTPRGIPWQSRPYLRDRNIRKKVRLQFLAACFNRVGYGNYIFWAMEAVAEYIIKPKMMPVVPEEEIASSMQEWSHEEAEAYLNHCLTTSATYTTPLPGDYYSDEEEERKNRYNPLVRVDNAGWVVGHMPTYIPKPLLHDQMMGKARTNITTLSTFIYGDKHPFPAGDATCGFYAYRSLTTQYIQFLHAKCDKGNVLQPPTISVKSAPAVQDFCFGDHKGNEPLSALQILNLVDFSVEKTLELEKNALLNEAVKARPQDRKLLAKQAIPNGDMGTCRFALDMVTYEVQQREGTEVLVVRIDCTRGPKTPDTPRLVLYRDLQDESMTTNHWQVPSRGDRLPLFKLMDKGIMKNGDKLPKHGKNPLIPLWENQHSHAKRGVFVLAKNNKGEWEVSTKHSSAFSRADPTLAEAVKIPVEIELEAEDWENKPSDNSQACQPGPSVAAPCDEDVIDEEIQKKIDIEIALELKNMETVLTRPEDLWAGKGKSTQPADMCADEGAVPDGQGQLVLDMCTDKGEEKQVVALDPNILPPFPAIPPQPLKPDSYRKRRRMRRAQRAQDEVMQLRHGRERPSPPDDERPEPPEAAPRGNELLDMSQIPSVHTVLPERLLSHTSFFIPELEDSVKVTRTSIRQSQEGLEVCACDAYPYCRHGARKNEGSMKADFVEEMASGGGIIAKATRLVTGSKKRTVVDAILLTRPPTVDEILAMQCYSLHLLDGTTTLMAGKEDEQLEHTLESAGIPTTYQMKLPDFPPVATLKTHCKSEAMDLVFTVVDYAPVRLEYTRWFEKQPLNIWNKLKPKVFEYGTQYEPATIWAHNEQRYWPRLDVLGTTMYVGPPSVGLPEPEGMYWPNAGDLQVYDWAPFGTCHRSPNHPQPWYPRVDEIPTDTWGPPVVESRKVMFPKSFTGKTLYRSVDPYAGSQPQLVAQCPRGTHIPHYLTPLDFKFNGQGPVDILTNPHTGERVAVRETQLCPYALYCPTKPGGTVVQFATVPREQLLLTLMPMADDDVLADIMAKVTTNPNLSLSGVMSLIRRTVKGSCLHQVRKGRTGKARGLNKNVTTTAMVVAMNDAFNTVNTMSNKTPVGHMNHEDSIGLQGQRCNYCKRPDREGGKAVKFKNGLCEHHAKVIKSEKIEEAPSATHQLMLEGEAIGYNDLVRPENNEPFIILGKNSQPPAVEMDMTGIKEEDENPFERIFPITRHAKRNNYNLAELLWANTTVTQDDKLVIDYQAVENALPGELKNKKKFAKAVLKGYGTRVIPSVHESCFINCVKAIVTRVARRPKNTPEAIAYRLARRWMLCKVQCGDFTIPDGGVETMPVEEWLETVKNKEAMAKALSQIGGTFDGEIGLPKLIWELFVKTEAGTNDKPRAIQSMPPAWQAMMGPLLKTIIRHVKKMWNANTSYFYAGGSNPTEMNDYLNNVFAEGWEDSKYKDNDYKMYDCTHSHLSFDFVDWFYQLVGQPTREELKCLWRMRVPKGRFAGGKGKYSAPSPQNGSGRPDTALLNIVCSMAAIAVCLTAMTNGLSMEQLESLNDEQFLRAVNFMEQNNKIVASGDDSSIKMAKWIDDAPFEALMARFGFTLETNPKDHFVDLVFLGNMPYPTPDGRFAWGPTIGRRAYKHHWMLDPKGDHLAWLHGVADMENRTLNHVPILADMALRTMILLKNNSCNKGKKFYKMPDDAQYKMQCVEDTGPHTTTGYTVETLKFLELKYGVSTEQLLDCIKAIHEVEFLPYVLNHPVLDRIMNEDDGVDCEEF